MMYKHSRGSHNNFFFCFFMYFCTQLNNNCFCQIVCTVQYKKGKLFWKHKSSKSLGKLQFKVVLFNFRCKIANTEGFCVHKIET